MFASTINNKGKKEKNKKVMEGPCIFPFKYKWTEHNSCYATEKGDICATSLQNNKRRTLKTYGYCQKPKKKPKTIKLKKKIKIKKIDNKITTKRKTIKKPKIKKISKKIKLKTKPQFILLKNMDINNKYIKLLTQLEELMKLEGEPFRARAYHKAAESIMLITEPIVDISELKDKSGIGSTILKKLEEFNKTGTLRVLERAKNNPIYLFPKIYGIGPKKTKQLIKDGVTNIEQLRKRKNELLNEKQKIGLDYFEDIEKRIPRSEIDNYTKVFTKEFKKLKSPHSSFEVVGSYRRGAKDSGDIDIIITNSQNDNKIFTDFINALQKKSLLIEMLSKGDKKSLTIGQLPGKTPRRLDFMYAPPDEYAFATLYFTGSKEFNVVMRQRALDIGYSMNEHGLYEMKDRKKGAKLDMVFPTEQSIFEFLGMVYKKPTERIDGRAFALKTKDAEIGINKNSVNKKIRKPKIKTMKRKKNKVTTFQPRKALIALKKDGISALQILNEEQLSSMIRYANNAYYNKKPVVTDNVYDILKEFIQRNYPENIAIQEVGAPIQKNKVVLPYYMGSMEKIKPDTGALTRWEKKYSGPYVISAKLDGMSVMYSTENNMKKLYSRGGATFGLDLSHMIPYLQLPEQENITIRGELIIPIELFDKKYKNKGYKSARNFVGGMMNSKGREVSKWKDLDFVAYEVIEPILKPSSQMEWLSSHNVITVKNTNAKTISNEYLSKVLVDWRSNYMYEIDGIIVVNDKIYPRENKNPAHAFAFKMVLSDQVAEVKVLDVIYSITKYGYLKPVIQIEPVHIRGADIEFATAHNIKNVIDNKIGIGAIVQLSRSGDVIPKIEKVIIPAEEPKLPDVVWKFNETNVDALLVDFEKSDEVRDKNIISFFTILDIPGFGEGNIQKVINAGYNSIGDILGISKSQLLVIPGFQEKTATKIKQGIDSVMTEVSLPILMKASNFGRGMGESRIVAVLDVYPNILTSPETQDEKIKMISQINGFAKKTASLFVSNIPIFLEFIRENNLESKLHQSSKIQNHPLKGRKILMTGFRNKALIKKIKAVGGTIATNASSKVFIVLVPTMDSDTGKAEEARLKKLTLMTPEIFQKKYFE